MKSNKAYGIIELLAMSLIMLVILTSCLKLLSTFNITLQINQKKYQETYLNMQLLGLVSRAIKYYDQNIIVPKPEILKSNSLHWNTGEYVVFNNPGISPMENSEILTYIRSNFRNIFLIKEHHNSIFCSSSKQEMRSGEAVAFNAEKRFIVKYSLIPTTADCYFVEFDNTKTLLNLEARDTHNLLGFLPIQAINSIYLDQTNNLRFMTSHDGQITENQPIGSGFTELNFMIAPHKIFQIQIETKYQNFAKKSFHINSARIKPNFHQILNLL